jgi:hypothetical protein
LRRVKKGRGRLRRVERVEFLISTYLNPSQPFSTLLNPSQPFSTLLNPSQLYSPPLTLPRATASDCEKKFPIVSSVPGQRRRVKKLILNNSLMGKTGKCRNKAVTRCINL